MAGYRGESFSYSGVGGTSVTLSNPGVLSGDVMFAVLEFNGTTGIVNLNVPSGWNRITPDDINIQDVLVYQKEAGSSEPASYEWTFSGGGGQSCSAILVAYYGYNNTLDSSTPIYNTYQDSATPIVSSFTPAKTNELVLCFWGQNHDGNDLGYSVSTPSGVTSREIISNVFNAYALAAGDFVQASESATPNYAAVFTNSTGYGWAIVIGLELTYTAPNAPTLLDPANGTYADVSSGYTFGPIAYNSTDSQPQNGYAFAVVVGGTTYNWNAVAQTWTAGGSSIWNSISTPVGGEWDVTVPAGGPIANGNAIQWKAASQESGASLQSSFSSPFTLNAQQAPSTVVTAPTGTETTTQNPVAQWVNTLHGSTQAAYQIVVESGAYGTTPGFGTTVWSPGQVSGANTLQLIVPALANGTYRIFVQIANNYGQLSAWAYSTFTVALPLLPANAPTNVTAFITPAGLFECQWISGAAVPSYPVTSFTVFAYSDGQQIGSQVVGGSVTTASFSFPSLAQGTAVQFAIFATNANGNSPTVFSNQVIFGSSAVSYSTLTVIPGGGPGASSLLQSQLNLSYVKVLIAQNATTTPYNSLQVSWTLPAGSWNEIVLVRSAYGAPQSIYARGGVILLDQTEGATPQPWATSFIDTGLQPGFFYYYSLFVFNTAALDQATPGAGYYQLVGSAQGLCLTQYNFAEMFQTYLPNTYLQDDALLNPGGSGPLVQFLSLLGYEMDWMRSEIETLILSTSVNWISGLLLPYLGANLGISYEPELGMAQSRVLIANAAYMYKWKGTQQGIEAVGTSYTGFGCVVTIGPNLEIQLDDGAFDRSVGHWIAGNLSTSVAVTSLANPQHDAYIPAVGFPYTGYLPQNNSNVLEVSGSGDIAWITSAGAAEVTVLGIPVVAGEQVVSSAFFEPVSTLRSFFVQLDWYGPLGNLISSTIGSSVAESTGVFNQAFVVGTAPVTGTVVRTIKSTTALASDIHYVDAIQTEINSLATPGPTHWSPPRDIRLNLLPVRQNLIPNPVGLAGTYGWGIVGGTMMPSQSAAIAWPAGTASGFVIESAVEGATPVTVTIYNTVPLLVNPEVAYSFSIYMGASAVSRNVLLEIEYLSASGAVLATDTSQFVDTVFERGAVVGFTAPSGAHSANIYVSLLDILVSNEIHYFGAPMLAPEPGLLPYFDANFVPSSDYLWEGTANKSISDYYPNLLPKLSRLISILPEFTPIGSTFSLVVGQAAVAAAALAG